MERANTIFRLKNTRLDRVLAHPSTGTMYVRDRAEADDMLAACHQYLEAVGLGQIKGEFVVEEIDAETLQEM